MDYKQFLSVIEDALRIDTPTAERAAQVTLSTLAQRLNRGEALDLVRELPPELGPALHTEGHPDPFDADEFVRRAAARLQVPPDTAELWVKIVLQALARAISDKQYDDLVALLPRSFARLLPRGPDIEVAPGDAFLDEVAAAAGLDTDAAARATDAVLQTLAERIAAGEVDDLAERLDKPWRESLLRGRRASGPPAPRMGLEQFVTRVAEREGVDPTDARAHARAVLVTLRRTVGPTAFSDIVSQLPPAYDVLWAGA
jgi:uncharacterized protein (DUF2267 family)